MKNVLWSALFMLAAMASARADDLPVTVDATAIGGNPKVKTQSTSAGSTTMAEWRKDDQNRSLFLLVLEPKSGAKINPKLQPLFDAQFKEGLTVDKDEADVRDEGSGSLDVWGGHAEWMMGSERAEQNPLFSMDNTSSKASRGDARRYCVQFVWKGDGREAVAGSYCQQPASKPTAQTMLEPLAIKLK
jgi:hypothetical protein